MSKKENELLVSDQMQMAEILSQSKLISNWFNTPVDAFVALQFGKELGLQGNPVQTLMNIFMIEKRPCLSSDMMFALAKKHPDYRGTVIKGNDKICTVTMKREYPNGTKEEVTGSFSIEEAESADLLKKNNWKYKSRMLKNRAVSYTVKDLFPDIFAGISTPDEIPMEKSDEKTTLAGDFEIVSDNGEVSENVAVESINIIVEEEPEEVKTLKKEISDLIENNNLSDEDKDDLNYSLEIAKNDLPKLNDVKSTIKFWLEDNVKTKQKMILDLFTSLNYNDKHQMNSIEKHLGTKTVMSCIDDDKLDTLIFELQEKLKIKTASEQF